MNNKISIILSTYNEYQTVEKTISEIFLKLENVEIIVVDDNSNDGTLEKLNSIKDENLKVFSRNTRGLTSAFFTWHDKYQWKLYWLDRFKHASVGYIF